LRSAVLCAGLILAASSAHATGGLRSDTTVTLEFATDLAQATVKACSEKGFNVSAAVVDRSGYLKALVRADGANPHSIEISSRKAYTAAMLRYETGKLVENIGNGVTPPGIMQVPGIIALYGGIPILAGKEVVGGVGASGAPDGRIERECVDAALKQLEDRLVPTR